MDFVRIEKSEPDDKGNIKVDLAISGQEVSSLLSEFYETVAASKGLAKDTPHAEVAQVASKTLGEEAFTQLERDYVVNRMIGEAFSILKLKPAITPQIHVLEYPEEGQEYAVDVSIVEAPVLRLSSYEPVEIEMEEVLVDDRMIATRVAEVLDHFADFHDAEAKPVSAEDVILVDIDTQLGDQIVPQMSGKGRILEMGSNQLPAPLVNQIIGMDIGETKVIKFDMLRDRAISSEDKEEYISTVTVHAQQDKVEVELTDEWVQAHYPSLSSVKEFFEEARKDVEYDVRLYNQDTIAHLANIEIEKRLEGVIPDAFYQASYKSLHEKLERDLAEKGKTLDDYCEEEKTNEEELSVKMLIQSGENLRQGFALEALFDGRDMQLTDEDVESAGARFFGDGITVANLKASGRYKLAANMAKRYKALNWLVETAVIKGE